MVTYRLMKRCPACRRTYPDRALKYCRFDRVTLVEQLEQLDDSDETIDLSLAPQIAATSRDISRSLPAQTASPSIAVLPFVNMSADQENEYFCDGLAEEVLNALAQLDGLKVAARTSSFHFRNKDTTIDQIGKALNVSTVLEGSVRKLGDRVRVTAQLINVADGYHLWSARYDRRLQDVFDIQDQITQTIVDALRLKLLGSANTSRLKRQTANKEAYVAYLKGRYYLAKFSVEAGPERLSTSTKRLAVILITPPRMPETPLPGAHVGITPWNLRTT